MKNFKLTCTPPPLFRVWDGKEMLYDIPESEIFRVTKMLAYKTNRNLVYMMSIDLVDINHEAIFDKDIIQIVKQNIIGNPLCNPFVRIVFWNRKKARYSLQDSCGGITEISDYLPNIRIIGNMYESKELLLKTPEIYKE